MNALKAAGIRSSLAFLIGSASQLVAAPIPAARKHSFKQNIAPFEKALSPIFMSDVDRFLCLFCFFLEMGWMESCGRGTLVPYR